MVGFFMGDEVVLIGVDWIYDLGRRMEFKLKVEVFEVFLCFCLVCIFVYFMLMFLYLLWGRGVWFDIDW